MTGRCQGSGPGDCCKATGLAVQGTAIVPRRDDRPLAKPREHSGRGQWAVEVVALHDVAPQLREGLEGRLVLNAFGHQDQPERVS